MPGAPSGEDAFDVIDRLRNSYVPAAFSGVPAEAYVGGISADYMDFNERLTTYLPIIFAFILGVSFVLLLIVFRSIVIPIKAIIMNLLSAGAAYGLMVLVFQKGVGADIFGFQQIDTIEAWLPLVLFAILFGLSMDYHVFMLSRIRERYDQTHDNAESVAYGLRSTSSLITGAALIMVAVFSGFASGDMVVNQQAGFGLAVADIADNYIAHTLIGDPLGEAMTADLAELSTTESRRLIEAAMQQEDKEVLRDAPASLREFFRDAEAPPEWLDYAAFAPSVRMFHRNSSSGQRQVPCPADQASNNTCPVCPPLGLIREP